MPIRKKSEKLFNDHRNFSLIIYIKINFLNLSLFKYNYYHNHWLKSILLQKMFADFFQCRFNGRKWLLVSRIYLDCLSTNSDFYITQSFNQYLWRLFQVPPITIGIIVTLMVHSFLFSSKVYIDLSLLSLSFNFPLWSAVKAEFTIRLVLFVLLICTKYRCLT